VKFVLLVGLAALAVGFTTAQAAPTRTPALVTPEDISKSLAHRYFLDRGGNQIGPIWMAQCDGLNGDGSGSYSTFSCYLSVKTTIYFQVYRTWMRTADTFTWTRSGPTYRLVKSGLLAP